MTMGLVVGFLAIVSLGACASGGSKPAAAPSTTATASVSSSPKRGSSNLITQAEIESTSLELLYDVIERLRPSMLRARGQTSRLSSGAETSTIKVYHNGTLMGDLSSLRSIQSSSVKQVEFLSSSDATTRFGTGNAAGAIVITSK